MLELKRTEEDYFKCERCNIDSLGERMCPCPRGSCDAVLSGTVTTVVTLNDVLTKEQIERTSHIEDNLTKINKLEDTKRAKFFIEGLRDDERKTSEEWQKLYPEVKVLDPDGWHRDERFQYEWYEEKISYTEYIMRRMRSTCMGNIKK